MHHRIAIGLLAGLLTATPALARDPWKQADLDDPEDSDSEETDDTDTDAEDDPAASPTADREPTVPATGASTVEEDILDDEDEDEVNRDLLEAAAAREAAAAQEEEARNRTAPGEDALPAAAAEDSEAIEETAPEDEPLRMMGVMGDDEALASTGFRPVLDVELGTGLVLFTDGLGSAGRLHVGLGLTPDLLGGRLRLLTEIGYARPGARGFLDDPRLEDPLDWRLRVHRADVGVGLGASVWNDEADVNIEFLAVPRLALFHAAQTTGSDDAPMGVGRETYLRPGLHLGAGVTGPVGAGELAVHLGATLQSHRGALTGPAGAVTPSVLLRYRYALRQRS